MVLRPLRQATPSRSAKTGGPLPQLHEGGDWSVPWNEWGEGGALNA